MWDRAKSIEAIVYLACRLKDPTKLKIFKLLYFADKLHMSRYGRFILGDYYAALKHGPVPSKTYDMVKEVEEGQVIDAFTVRNKRDICPNREAELVEFSETDIECLDEILRVYGRATATQVRNISHGDAWNKASNNGAIFDDGNSPNSVPIPLEYIVDELPNSTAVRNLLQREGYL